MQPQGAQVPQYFYTQKSAWQLMLLLMLPGDNSENCGVLSMDTCQGEHQASAQHGLQVHCGEEHRSVAGTLNQDLLGLQVKVSKAEEFMLRYELCMQYALSSAATC